MGHVEQESIDRLARHLGAALAAARRQAGLTQEGVAELAGLVPSFIARVERGARLPSPMVLERIAEAVGIEVADIWPRRGAPKKRKGVAPRQTEREVTVARLLKVLEPLTTSDLRQLTTLVQRLLRKR